MKKQAVLILLLVSFPFSSYAINLNFGIYYGGRTVNDSLVKEVYGQGSVYRPCFNLNIWKGIIVGVAYERGYSKEGKIGIYGESASLEVSGFEAFLGYQFKIDKFYPYLKIGYGRFSYKQSIDSPYAADYKVDHKKSTWTAGVGLKIYPVKYLFISGEFKYIPLEVKPFEEVVDLGGIRYLVGIGFTF